MANAPLPADQKVRHIMMAVIIRASIAEQVRALRLSRNCSQQKLAKGIGTTQSCIARIESPRGAMPHISTLEKIAAFFDVGLRVHFTSWSDFIETYCGKTLPPPMSFSMEKLV